MIRNFNSDNSSGVDKRVLEYLSEINEGHCHSYGEDYYTLKAKEEFEKIFGKCEVFFVPTGTGANVFAMDVVCERYNAILTSDNSHIMELETGALTRVVGCPLFTANFENGKFDIKRAEKYLKFKINYGRHASVPKVISITQVTDFGEVYTLEEIKKIAKFAHKNDMLLHVDGARLSNSVVSLSTTFNKMIKETGVDILSFGGTKNGLMFGEVVLFFYDINSEKAEFLQKQDLSLVSKMRFVSAQYLVYLKEKLWEKNAKHSNLIARKIEIELKNNKEIQILNNVDANMIFAKLSDEKFANIMKKDLCLSLDNEKNIVRIVASFDNTTEDIKTLFKALQ